jgi:basic membrane protein A
MVIGVGFIFTDDVLQVAADHPKTSFVCVDMTVRPDAVLPANVLALKYKEEQGSFLAGAFAALVSKTKHVGFVGGMDIPLIHKFSAGFRAGVSAQCEDCRVDVLFAGATPAAFKDPGKGREMALSQYQNGADVIFHASGSTGLGVFQAAREQHKFAIGCDSDQSAEAPEVVVTSMVKRIDTGVFEAIDSARRGAPMQGVVSLGLKEAGLDLARNDMNAHFFTPERVAIIAALRSKIESGEIQVPAND